MAKIKLVVGATIEEIFSDFIIPKKTKGLAEKTLRSYQSQFKAVPRYMDVKMDIAMLLPPFKSPKPPCIITALILAPGAQNVKFGYLRFHALFTVFSPLLHIIWVDILLRKPYNGIEFLQFYPGKLIPRMSEQEGSI